MSFPSSAVEKIRKFAWGAVAAAAVLAAAVYVAHRAGEETATKQKERLALVWPSIMDMPQDDRAFLVGLSMTCDLHRQPVEKAAVLECLRPAAATSAPTLPAGFDKASAAATLESLLPAVDRKEAMTALTAKGAYLDETAAYPLILVVTRDSGVLIRGSRIFANAVPDRRAARHEAQLARVVSPDGCVAQLAGYILDDDGARGLRYSHVAENSADTRMYDAGHAVTLIVTERPQKCERTSRT